MTRSIEDILYFRSDISPFLVHLTRSINSQINAQEVLEKIVQEKRLVAGNSPVSDARFGIKQHKLDDEKKKRFFGAVCLTETPLNEIHCLLDISYRQINLDSYGLVFLKEKLRQKGVSPVLYFNNEQDDKDKVFEALCSLIDTHPNEAAKFLPLVAVFGQKVKSPSAIFKPNGIVDFLWEREWRYPSDNGSLEFTKDDIFVGLCPHDKIEYFESIFEDVDFIDPTRNVKWYATKLVKARKRLGIKNSVV